MIFQNQKVFFTTIAAILGYIGIYLLVRHFYVVDTATLMEKAKALHSGVNIKPEPRETFLFQLGVVFLPIISLLVYFFLNTKGQKYLQRINADFLGFVTCLVLLVWVYLAFAAENPHYVENATRGENERDVVAATNFDFYFLGYNFANIAWFYFLLIVPVFCGIYYTFRTKVLWAPIKRLRDISIILISGLLLWIIWDIFQFPFPFTWESQYDLAPLFYPQVNVFFGKAMLVDHFTSNYGLSAHFLDPKTESDVLAIIPVDSFLCHWEGIFAVFGC
jgi:hypothetical protein